MKNSVALFILFPLSIFPPLFAQDWPQWRGPARAGVARGFVLPQTWPANLTKKWQLEIGMGHASPIVSAGKGFMHTRKGENEVVSCLKLVDGKTVWQKDYRVPHEMNFAAVAHGKDPKSTPIINNGRLYTFGISGIILCFKAATGELKLGIEANRFAARRIVGILEEPALELRTTPVLERCS